MSERVEREREAFETWLQEFYPARDLERYEPVVPDDGMSGEYVEPHAFHAWRAWQAARSRPGEVIVAPDDAQTVERVREAVSEALHEALQGYNVPPINGNAVADAAIAALREEGRA